ncbi:MAG: phage holin family protein [Chloroflexi bacterium]|nr:phage holin family protein [Chloroflexota bacterium]
MNLLLRLLVSAGAVFLAQAIPGGWVHVDNFGVALLFAIVLGILNAIVRPVLLLLTCPFTLLTLGLFIFVVNALVFWLASALIPGIQVNGFVGALIGSLIVSACSAIASNYLE